MRIAVTYSNGQIFEHFGHTEIFKIFDCENREIFSSTFITSNGQGHGALAKLLADNNVEVLICGGIGGGAINALASANIKIYQGCSGDVDLLVKDYLSGKLEYNPEAVCTHHDHECSDHESCSDHTRLKLSRK